MIISMELVKYICMYKIHIISFQVKSLGFHRKSMKRCLVFCFQGGALPLSSIRRYIKNLVHRREIAIAATERTTIAK